MVTQLEHAQVEALLREWDPIGVIHVEVPQSWDEYAPYASAVLRMLADGCNPEMLAAYLEDCRTQSMGLRANPKADLAIATKMVEWWHGRTEPQWHPFSVEGEAFHWRTYQSQQKTGRGPWERCEFLEVARLPNVPGVGASHPPGTTIGEEHARALVRLFAESGQPIP